MFCVHSEGKELKLKNCDLLIQGEREAIYHFCFAFIFVHLTHTIIMSENVLAKPKQSQA